MQSFISVAAVTHEGAVNLYTRVQQQNLFGGDGGVCVCVRESLFISFEVIQSNTFCLGQLRTFSAVVVEMRRRPDQQI